MPHIDFVWTSYGLPARLSVPAALAVEAGLAIAVATFSRASAIRHCEALVRRCDFQSGDALLDALVRYRKRPWDVGPARMLVVSLTTPGASILIPRVPE